MCLGRAESTGGRGLAEVVTVAESDVDRAGCLRIETGVAVAGRVTEAAGDGPGTTDRDDDAAEAGLNTGVGADAILGGGWALCTYLTPGELGLGN